jgi:hypothetical protein
MTPPTKRQEEKAHDLVRNWIDESEGNYSLLIDRVAAALAVERREALEEAASIVGDIGRGTVELVNMGAASMSDIKPQLTVLWLAKTRIEALMKESGE